MRNRYEVIAKVVGALFLFIVWEILSLYAPKLVPHIHEIAASLILLFTHLGIQRDIVSSLIRTIIAFGLAIVIAIPLGITMGSVRVIWATLKGPVEFLRSIPAFVLLPLLLAIFRSGESARIAMAAIGGGLVILANTAFGAFHVHPLRIEVARTYGAGNFFILTQVVWREVAPQALDGCRIALSLVLILVIVSEIMLGATYGLGTRVNDSLAGFDLPKMYALIIVIGGLGFALNVVAERLTRRLADYGSHL